MFNDFEKNIVQIELIKKDNQEKIQLGSGFFIDKKTIITASHVINEYYENPEDYEIYIIPVKLELEKIKVMKLLNPTLNNYISFLEIENDIDGINDIKFTTGYEIKNKDNYNTYGYPSSKRDLGFTINNTMGNSISDFQSKKIDWELNLTNERLDNFNGLSGAPVFIDDMLIGIIQTQSDSNGKASSLGISSINIMKELIPDKYKEEINQISYIYYKSKEETKKIYKILDIEKKLIDMTEYELDLNFFESDDKEFKENLKNQLADNNKKNIYISGKTREEAIYSVLFELKRNFLTEKVLIVKDKDSWNFLKDKITDAILIPDFYDNEINSLKNNKCIFVHGNNEISNSKNTIKLKKRTRKTLVYKLEKIGLKHENAFEYVKKTNGIYPFLKQIFFNGHYTIEKPKWSEKNNISVIIALLIGKWTENNGDKEIIEKLTKKKYEDFLQDLSTYMDSEEPFIVTLHEHAGMSYQIANPELAWNFLNKKINDSLWKEFEEIFKKCIINIDPYFSKPTETHYLIYDKNEKSCYSFKLKEGMIRSLIFRVLIDDNQQYYIDKIILEILSNIKSINEWAYYSQFFTDLCELSPKSIIKHLENELDNPTGMIDLFSDNKGDFFTRRSYYTNILWAIEQLLLYKDYSMDAFKLLIEIDNLNLNYSMSNNPYTMLKEIFCSWFNKYSFNNSDKEKLAKKYIKESRSIWKILLNDISGKNDTMFMNSNKPEYREVEEIDSVTVNERLDLMNKYARLCIDNINKDLNRWIDIIEEFSVFPEKMFDEIISSLENELNSTTDENKRIIKDKIRKVIYKHRFHNSAAWSMKESRIKKVEAFFNNIKFDNNINDYIYLFEKLYKFPLLNPIPFNKGEAGNDRTNETKKEELIESKIIEFKEKKINIFDLIISVDKACYRRIGEILAKYYFEYKYNEDFIKELLKNGDYNQIIISFISTIYNKGNKDVLKQILSLLNKKEHELLYVYILLIEQLDFDEKPLIIDESEDIKRIYWGEKFSSWYRFHQNEKTLKWILSELFKYNNLDSFIEYLHKSLKILNSEDIFVFTMNILTIKQNNPLDSMKSFYLEEIVKYIENQFHGQDDKIIEIYQFEMFFRDVIPLESLKTVQYSFKTDPKYYAWLIENIYFKDNEEKNKSKDKNLGGKLYSFYYKFHFCPCENNGEIHFEELNEWVKKFQELLKEQDQINLFGDQLGRLFAYSPVGKDGYYPHESVRRIIEEEKDEKLNEAYIITITNQRGVYTPDAGKTEKEMALQYKKISDIFRFDYPECSKIYIKLFKKYLKQSEFERKRAEDEF